MKFGIIGGDDRQLYMANCLENDGHTVYLAGFDDKISAIDVAKLSDVIIFPIPIMRDGAIYAPLSSDKIEFDDELIEHLKGKKIFGGMVKCLSNIYDKIKDIKIYDILDNEYFTILNAVPSAEGGIYYAIKEFKGTIHDSNCLVCGYGRIGKVLANNLKNLGANVTVSARKSKDLAWIRANCCTPVYTESLDNLPNNDKFDIIFNTVPYMIFDKDTIKKLTTNDSVIIDLASLPYGVDIDACNELGIKGIRALSLPGKFSPKTSGEIIKRTICRILEEENI